MQPNGKCVAILFNKQCIICNSILKSQWWKTVCRAKDGSKLSIAKVAEAKNKAQLPVSDPNSDEADAGGNSSAQTRSETRKFRIIRNSNGKLFFWKYASKCRWSKFSQAGTFAEYSPVVMSQTYNFYFRHLLKMKRWGNFSFSMLLDCWN